MRTDELLIQVFENGLKIRGEADANLTEDGRWRINIPVSGATILPKAVVYAELWQKSKDGSLSPVNWISGMSYAETYSKRTAAFSLTLDARWLNFAKADAKSFELRNIRIQDPNHFVTVAESEAVNLPNVYLTEEVRTRFTGEIDDEMRQGRKPFRAADSAVN